jgi:hypothetical protein
MRIVSFQRVADGIFTERANPFRQYTARPAFRLDAMHSGKLASRAQKHSVKDLLPGMVGITAPFRQSLHVRGEIKDLIQIGFESVPVRGGYDFSFFFKK